MNTFNTDELICNKNEEMQKTLSVDLTETYIDDYMKKQADYEFNGELNISFLRGIRAIRAALKPLRMISHSEKMKKVVASVFKASRCSNE